MPMAKMTNTEYANRLLKSVQDLIDQGLNAEQAIEQGLTINQYDWLIDHDINIDEMLISREKRDESAKALKKERGRRLSPNGYDKKYPQEKQNLYNYILGKLKEYGAQVANPEKCNFRDIDFSVNGTDYKIVISMPRTKK